jgi:hypothetical protein
VDWASRESYYSASVSVVDLGRFSELINHTNELSIELNKSLALFKQNITGAIDETESYKQAPLPRDLYHFAELLKSQVHYQPLRLKAQELMDVISEVVIANERWTSPWDEVAVDNAHGITIWLPKSGSSAQYRSLDFAKLTQWDEFLDNYKLNIARPNVHFIVEAEVADSNGDGIDDIITVVSETNVTGLNMSIDVCCYNNDQVLSYSNNSVSGMKFTFSFDPYSHGKPADYYNFYFYLLDDSGSLQNYTELLDVWLGNERPDLSVNNMSIYRADNETIDGVKKRPIMGQETLIDVIIFNVGTEDISEIDVVFLDDGDIFGEQTISLDTGEQTKLSQKWIPQFEGEHSLEIIVDYNDDIKEINETNNKITRNIDVKSVLPLYFFKLEGRVLDEGGNNIRGAKVTIKNLRTSETVNVTTDKFGYEVTLKTDWYQEGDLIEIKASYESASSKQTFQIYSEDREKECDFTLETDDWLNIFKFTLMLFEIFGFVLVVRYYTNIRKLKKNKR